MPRPGGPPYPDRMTASPHTRSLGYFTDVALRRHEGATVTRHRQHTSVQSPFNPSFWWGNYLLLDEAPTAGTLDAWEAEFRRTFPEAAHTTFGVNLPAAELTDLEHLRARGYGAYQDTVLTAARTHAPRTLNRDAQLRPPRTDADWAAVLELRMAVNAADPHGHATDGYRTFAQGKLGSYRRLQEGGHGTYLAAFDDQGRALSGLGIFDCGDGVARYQSVETHPEYRARGLAGTLVHTAAEWAREHHGTRQLVIVADPGYHAQALYESVGFAPTETQTGLEKRPAE